MCAEKSAEPAESLDPRSDPSLPLDTIRGIDEVCQRFEQALRAGDRPPIEGFLPTGPGREGTALLRELLALELEYRLRSGQQPAPEEYLPRFPGDREVVDLAFWESRRGLPHAVPAFLADHPRYRVLRFSASGGMGSVFCAEHRVLRRTVALKIIKPELLADARAVERFAGEARAAASLSHPNIVTVFDAETAGEGHFLVMEYVAGTDLASAVIRGGPLPVAVASDYIRQAALGLQHAHQCGMVHRDISPRNLMLTEGGQIKVLDFGLASFASRTRSVDRQAVPGMLLGSIDYLAPEQAADPDAADTRADIYGLGCTLFFLLTGQPPFPEGTALEKIEAHARLAPPPVHDLRQDVPPELSRVLDRMLAKSPGDRYQTPLEVADALAAFAASDRAGDSPTTGQKGRRGRRTWSFVALGLLIATLGWAGWRIAALRPGGPQESAPPEATEASRLYREGLFLLGQRQEVQTRQAIKRLEAACKLDPSFALAHTALADAYNLCGDYGWEMAGDVYPKAKQAARRALDLDDDLAEAHLALALALETYDCDWRQAEAEYRRALGLKPHLPAAHHWYAWFLAQQGRFDEAAAHIEQAQQLAPAEVIIANNVGKIRYLRRAYPSAVEKFKYALELSPDFRKAHRDLGFAYAEMGRLDESLREFDEAKGLTEDGRDLATARAYVYARNGRPDDARRLLPGLERLAERKPVAYEIATIYAALGEKAQALDWLDRAFREHSAGRTLVAVDPRLDGIRKEPRFVSLLKAAGLDRPE